MIADSWWLRWPFPRLTVFAGTRIMADSNGVGNSMVNQFGGDWTRAKLEILRGYLNTYTTALKKQNFNLIYVDAFAGTGYVDVRNSREASDEESTSLLKGSARLALEVNDKSFDSFIFIEQNINYAAELSKLKREFSGRSINIVQDDANEFLREWCSSQNHSLGTPWKGERAVIFLDPFATEVDWETARRTAETKSVDLWILFPLSALTRMLPNDREPDDASAVVMDRVLGEQKWREVLYQSSSQPTLFGDEQTQTVRGNQQAIVDFYQSKLNEVFPAVAANPKWFRNSRNSPLFALMFAAANEKGGPIALRIANDLLNRW